MTRVLVLGAEGMLGSMVARVLTANPALKVIRSTRVGTQHDLEFDATRHSVGELLFTTRCDWIINTIGILDRNIDESDPNSVAAAINVNSSFPNLLAAAAGRDRRIIHISTDGVFSGRHAPYDERAPHDAVGVYARTKSLGEPVSPNCVTLRCSIVGPEKNPARSLLGMTLSRPTGTVVTGYTNQQWNGVTTLHLAKLCAAVMQADSDLPSVLHVVPGDAVSKADLIGLFIAAYGRNDLTMATRPAAVPLDRTLKTVYPDVNEELWTKAGHTAAPTIAEMVRELAATCYP
jgi:dTDP-4-dehydrorhamnose reductase